MATELALDDDLVEEARRIGRHETEAGAVIAALHEYVQRRKQLELLELFGTIGFDSAYDHTRERQR